MSDGMWNESVEAENSQNDTGLWTWLQRHKGYCIAGCIFVIDLLILGPAAGTHMTASEMLDAPWTRVRAFASDYYRVDTLSLALVTSQIAALTLWCYNSRRIVFLRICVWLAVSVFLSFAIIAQAWSNITFLSMLFVIVPIGIGASVGHLISRLLGFRIKRSNEKDPTKEEQKQFGVSELMLLAAVASMLCVLIGWLNFIDAFQYIYRVPMWIAAEPMYFPKAICNGILGGMICVAAWGALANTRVLLRCLLAMLVIAFISWATHTFLEQYSQYVTMNYSSYRARSFSGWASWWISHSLFSLPILATARLFDLRFVYQPTQMPFGSSPKNRRVVFAVAALLLLTGIGYLASSRIPVYMANRKLLNALDSLNASIYKTQDNRVLLTIEGELDATATNALLANPVVTELHLMSPYTQGIEKHLTRLQFLNGIFFHSGIPQAAQLELQAKMPSTSITSWP